MKFQAVSLLLVSGTLVFSSSLSAQGLTFKTLNSCHRDYSEILSSENEDVTNVEELPPGVYLARSVTQSLEKKNEKYIAYQSMLVDSKSNSEVCFKGEPASSIKTQSFIPTVIDQTKTHKWGHTFWSLSAVLDKITGSVNSKRSLIPSENYRKALSSQGFKVSSVQKSHKEFQIRLERNIASWKETIVIIYDQFSPTLAD